MNATAAVSANPIGISAGLAGLLPASKDVPVANAAFMDVISTLLGLVAPPELSLAVSNSVASDLTKVPAQSGTASKLIADALIRSMLDSGATIVIGIAPNGTDVPAPEQGTSAGPISLPWMPAPVTPQIAGGAVIVPALPGDAGAAREPSAASSSDLEGPSPELIANSLMGRSPINNETIAIRTCSGQAPKARPATAALSAKPVKGVRFATAPGIPQIAIEQAGVAFPLETPPVEPAHDADSGADRTDPPLMANSDTTAGTLPAEVAFTVHMSASPVSAPPAPEPVVNSQPPDYQTVAAPVEPRTPQVTAPAEKLDSSKKPDPVQPGVLDNKASPSGDVGVRIAAVGSLSNASNFPRPFEAPLQASVASRNIDQKSDTPFAAAAETLRTSEPFSPPPTQPVSAPIQDITVRIARPEASVVDLHIAERSGEVRVSVRTPDAALQTSLREDLGTLTNSLERAGYRAETFVPRENALHASRSSEKNSGDDSQPREPASSGRRDQRQRGRQSQKWLEEMEKKQ